MVQKILVIEDDPVYQELFATLLDPHLLCVLEDAETSLSYCETWKPDLVVLNVDLSKNDGYQVCRRLKDNEVSRHIPLLFLSVHLDLQDQIKAYGAGADDYLTKPFDLMEFNRKVENLLAIKRDRDQLASTYGLVMDLQTSLSKLQAIGRFMQNVLFCNDVDSLFRHFFAVTRQIGISCVLRLTICNRHFIQADNGSVHQLEEEILSMAKNFERIKTFGKQRALFSWERSRLLVRNVGDHSDTVAILLEGLDRGIEALEREAELIHRVTELNEQNDSLKDAIEELFRSMTTDLRDIFVRLGFVTSLSVDEEDALQDFIEEYERRFTDRIGRLSTNTQDMIYLINRLRQPPETSVDGESRDESVSLF